MQYIYKITTEAIDATMLKESKEVDRSWKQLLQDRDELEVMEIKLQLFKAPKIKNRADAL